MAVTYDSTTDTYSMTFTDFETWFPSQSDNTVDTPYKVIITEYTSDNCRGAAINSSYPPIEGTFQYVLYNNLTKYISLKLESNLSVTSLYQTFRWCSNLITIDISGLSSVTNTNNAFFACKNLTHAEIGEMSLVQDARMMFDSCERLITIDISNMTALQQADRMFDDCKNLIYVKIGNSTPFTNVTEMFHNCYKLACISKFPIHYSQYWNTNCNSLFRNVTTLYNIGIIRNLNTGRSDALGGTNVKAVGALVSSLSAYNISAWNGTKFYTTSQYYDDLSTELATNYPSKNFQVIEVDACLDYDELEDWLQAQPQNTADTPYKIFIGGGLSADKVYGSYDEWGNITPSDLSNIILTYGKYVDLSATQLPSDCTDLTSSISGIWHELQSELIQQEYITAFCEIPNTVTTLNGFAAFATELKSFGINNEIPSSVINAKRAFQNNTKLEKIIVNHQINNNCDYTYWILNDLIKLYAKDCTFFLNERQQYHLNYQIILECDYLDLNTYLGWFRSSWEDVCLKVNGLISEELIGNNEPSDFGLALMGTNISNTTVKSYIINSTFDLRLTSIPNNQTSLRYCFGSYDSDYHCNVSYCFDIPDSVTDMSGTFRYSRLIESPELPSSLENLNNTFEGCGITEAPELPSNVLYMYDTFRDTEISVMPNIPNGVETLIRAFKNTNIITTTEIPSSVVYMLRCFEGCTSLEEVVNIPLSVIDMKDCFSGCTSLETINGWGVNIYNCTMTGCFTDCTNLTEINTTVKENVDYDRWVHITVKTDTTDNTKYNLTLRTLATETQPAQTLALQVAKDVIYSYLTDEILFSPSGTLSDSYITDMLNYKYPFGGGLDPSRKNFVLWAAQGSVVKQNLSSQSGFTGSDINVSNNNNTKIASIIGALTGDITQQGKVYSAISADAVRVGAPQSTSNGDIWIE